MKLHGYIRILLTVIAFMLQFSISSANEGLFKEARTLQRDGHFDDAIAAYKDYLSQPSADDALSGSLRLLPCSSGHMPERLLLRHGLCLIPHREYGEGGRNHAEGSYSSAA